MWCTTTYFYTLCVVFVTCKVLPAPGRNRNMGLLRDADLLETSGIRGQTQSEKVEDYEEVNAYIKKHEVGGMLSTKVEVVNAPKGQEAKKVYDVKMKKKWPNRSNSMANQTNQAGVFENNKAIVSLPEGQEIAQEVQKNEVEKLLSFYKSKNDGKIRVKRMNVIGTGGCPVGMIRYLGVGISRVFCVEDLNEFRAPLLKTDRLNL
ncbi:hypothetical protein EVAR_38087_1 [Eumeta japonica]|uniref:Uncharacterized protein n=1 Tax=Eumeta variegata TaxID=151549 RepID=A0A4C1W8C9_EUMVA|nr:hypothetical protein EVAR_38087_1 [Eumeta japonica]